MSILIFISIEDYSTNSLHAVENTKYQWVILI